VQQGPRLQAVIQGVLTVGNAVNVGTAYGNAQGIKLDSLLKLADVKVNWLLWHSAPATSVDDWLSLLTNATCEIWHQLIGHATSWQHAPSRVDTQGVFYWRLKGSYSRTDKRLT